MEFINEQGEATLERFAERLSSEVGDPVFVGYRDAYVDRMGFAPSANILELGCGTGSWRARSPPDPASRDT